MFRGRFLPCLLIRIIRNHNYHNDILDDDRAYAECLYPSMDFLYEEIVHLVLRNRRDIFKIDI